MKYKILIICSRNIRKQTVMKRFNYHVESFDVIKNCRNIIMIQKMLQSIFNYVSERIFMKIASRLNKRPEQAQEKLKKFFLESFHFWKFSCSAK